MAEQIAPDSGSEQSGVKLGAGAVMSLAGLLLLIIFMIQNRQSVQFRFLFWGLAWPLWLVIFVSAAFGALIWVGLGVMRRHRRRKERRASR